ncbi:MAG: MlrC C-terminal domain-containing protein, partial [Planctomycetota bacterium]
GRGNTAWLLKAFHASRLPGVVLGVFVDPPLARRAHELGLGAEFDAEFNSTEDSPFSEPYRSRVRVCSLHDGALVGRRDVAIASQSTQGDAPRLRRVALPWAMAVGCPFGA